MVLLLSALLACLPFASVGEEEQAEDEVQVYREKLVEKISGLPSRFESLPVESQERYLLRSEILNANADWLMCDKLGPLYQVSYAFHYGCGKSEVEYVLKVAGRYDRGVHFITPSELSFFGPGPPGFSYYTVEQCEYEGTEALKLSCKVDRARGRGLASASVTLSFPLPWQKLRTNPESLVVSADEYEVALYVASQDHRILGEILHRIWRGQNEVIVNEIHYDYGAGNFPKRVEFTTDDSTGFRERADMDFSMREGVWWCDRCTISTTDHRTEGYEPFLRWYTTDVDIEAVGPLPGVH